jgi:hypothetical protein
MRYLIQVDLWEAYLAIGQKLSTEIGDLVIERLVLQLLDHFE